MADTIDELYSKYTSQVGEALDHFKQISCEDDYEGIKKDKGNRRTNRNKKVEKNA